MEAILLAPRSWQWGWMTSRESRSLTGMKPVGGRACAIRNLCRLPSRPWTAVFPFSGGSSVLLCVWKGFFLEPEGVVSSWGDSFLLPFPAHPRLAGGGSSPSARPLARAAVFTPQLPRSACANSLPSSFWLFPISVQMCGNCTGMFIFASQKSLENRNLCWEYGNPVT